MTSYRYVAGETEIVLAAGLRTPQMKAGGAFAEEDPGHLASGLAREIFARHNLDGSEFDEVIIGCVGQPSTQANVARVIALRAGVPEHVPARTVARNCASGIEAVTSAISSIRAGEGSAYLCGGVEVMSGYPLIMGKGLTKLFSKLARTRTLGAALGVWSAFRPADLKPRIALLEGLNDPVAGMLMGETAELLAREFNISREDQDAYACRSHNRAESARDAGTFENEILPWLPLGSKGGARSRRHDDGIRPGQSSAALAKMKPYFVKPDGTVTVGNSCGITDGACILIISTAERAREMGLTPLARIRATAWAGLDPARMGLGPVHATHKVLRASGCQVSDLGAIELNEAFAAQVLACEKAFASPEFAQRNFGASAALGALDPDKLNRNGGAIALGHPVGATGARLLLSSAHELKRSDCELTLATLCIGGGQGGAVLLERRAS
ncbi:MAG: acetyl-CoA acetyltransferase family protein [Candidatus Paceibacteria bacterium]|jgi:acetyl-CoA acetyltransferase family protein